MNEPEDRLTRLEGRITVLEAHMQIREVLFRYCRAADRCDLPLMKSCYHPDALDDHGFFSGSGWEFSEHVIGLLRELKLSVHALANVRVDLDGQMAFVESQFSVIHRVEHALGTTDFHHHGRYLDLFEYRSEQWKIFRRVIVQDGERWFQTADLSCLTRESPNRPPAGQQSSDDPSYRRFEIGDLVRNRPKRSHVWRDFRRIAIAPVWLLRLIVAWVESSKGVRVTKKGG